MTAATTAPGAGATATPTLAELPLRPELVGELPYGAPQLLAQRRPGHWSNRARTAAP